MNKASMKARIAYGIENANGSRFTPIRFDQAEKLAQQALDATGWKSLAAAKRWLEGQNIITAL
ncbi:MAG: hypothetical protein GVY30_11815 [Chloroflexi bacterium]|nr:hypothetical protein [Chloroflexota bacterium]